MMKKLLYFLPKLIIPFFIIILLLGISLLLRPPKNLIPEETPKLTVIIVIDQFAYDYIPKLYKNFKYGLKELLDNGLYYENASYTHAITETTTGHLNLISGVYPKDNGGITNQWINKKGEKVPYEYDTAPNSIPFDTPPQDGGKSEKNTLVDTLSDQFIFHSTPATEAQVWALSLKSYPAIITAGRMGKALWFDEKKGVFTSTPHYFATLPNWVTEYNQKLKKIHDLIPWKTFYPPNSKAYEFPYIDNYEFAPVKGGYIANSPIKINLQDKKPYEVFMRTPLASQALLTLAQACINQNINLQAPSKMLLIISLSNLDLAGHLFGPDSREIIDTIYHLDAQIQNFLTYLKQKVGSKNVLIVLTADHGICPIPEIQQKKGFKGAHRINADKLIAQMNTEIETNFGVSNIIKAFEPTSFRINHTVFEKLNPSTQASILEHLKEFLKNQPGIKNAWTYDELANAHYEEDQIESYYQKQLYSDRIGDIICLPDYYCQITHYTTGTSHDSPYPYNLHVPLVIYQKGIISPKKIQSTVHPHQLPVTLAHLLHIQKPSATPFECLPGIELNTRS